MGLIDQARADLVQITSNEDDFGVPIAFEAPTGETKSIVGFHSKHHLARDTDGRQVSAKNAAISFAESLMTDYPVRGASGEVNLKNHKVTVKDSTDVDKVYVIREWFPDETLGLIVCILGDYE